MKLAYVLGILMVLSVVGCTQAPEETTEPVTTPPPMEEEAPEETLEPPEVEMAPEGEDVVFNGREGFDPEEITIAEGSTLNINVNDEGSAAYSFVTKETGDKTARLADGETGELVFKEAGEFTVMSIPFSKQLKITVE